MPPPLKSAQHRARRNTLQKLQEQLGYTFKDLGHLDRALVHASTGNEGRANYERMEFLGDAFLGFAVADALYRLDPEIPEGELTETRARLVSRQPLAAVARDLDLVSCMAAGKGLQLAARKSPRILADLVEAVIAAVYLDGGVRPARAFIRRHILCNLDDATGRAASNRDSKSKLLHFVQRRALGQPRYEISAVSGPQHEQEFEVEAFVEDRPVAKGKGLSKRDAEKDAAAKALRKLQAAEKRHKTK